jgi:hypothetical protein
MAGALLRLLEPRPFSIHLGEDAGSSMTAVLALRNLQERPSRVGASLPLHGLGEEHGSRQHA